MAAADMTMITVMWVCCRYYGHNGGRHQTLTALVYSLTKKTCQVFIRHPKPLIKKVKTKIYTRFVLSSYSLQMKNTATFMIILMVV